MLNVYLILMKTTILMVALAYIVGAEAGCEVDISEYVGWQIQSSGTVTGYIDEKGEEIDEFEGCDYGRVLIIDYSSTVTCEDYGYSYAYMPDIVIMSNGPRSEACIDGDMYDIR